MYAKPMLGELLLLIASRTLRNRGSYLFNHFALDAGERRLPWGIACRVFTLSA